LSLASGKTILRSPSGTWAATHLAARVSASAPPHRDPAGYPKSAGSFGSRTTMTTRQLPNGRGFLRLLSQADLKDDEELRLHAREWGELVHSIELRHELRWLELIAGGW
jgi:hypothetical protein